MLGERESTFLFARCATRRARFGLSLAASLIVRARVFYWFFQVMPMLSARVRATRSATSP